MKLGCRHNYHKGRAAIRHYADQPALPLRLLCWRPNFMSTYHGVNAHLAFFNVKVVVDSRSHPGEGPRRAFSVIVQPHRSIVCSSNVDVKQDTGDTCGHTLANGHGRHAAGTGNIQIQTCLRSRLHNLVLWQ